MTNTDTTGAAALALRDPASIMERAVIQGDLSQLSPQERVEYYSRVCDSLGLNKYTKPFAYLELDAQGGGKKLELYARKDCTDQLRDIKKVSITRLEKEWTQELYIVTAYAVLPGGRTDSAVGAVPISKEGGYWEDVTDRDGKPVTDKAGKSRRRLVSDGRFVRLTGDALANAIMKAETKAKRRVTLSICGLGMTDESEIDSIPGAVIVESDRYIPTREADAGDTTPRTAVVEMVTSADSRLWKRWLEVLAEAQGLGVRIKELRLPIALDELKTAANEALNGIAGRKEMLAEQEAKVAAQTIDQAAAEQRTYDEVFGEQEAPTEAELAAPRDVDTGEVLDTPAPAEPERPKIAGWQRNRQLVAEAQKRKLTGVPTLNARASLDVVEAANEELARRIRDYDLDQQLTREQQAAGLL
jgi:hypothetical protein